MSREYDYINISTSKIPAKPGLPHDLQLLRDLEIANARTVAELGPLPPGGLPVVPKRRVDAKGRPLFERADHQTTEKDEMKLNQMAAAAAMTAALVACEPQTSTEAAEQTQTTAPAVEQVASVAPEMHAEPKVVTVTERVTADAVPAVPDEIRAFVPQDSTLLAYKRFDLTGDGNEDVVLIIRHPVTETYADYSKNPCDLIVLHNEGHDFKLVAKGSKVIDCTYKNFERKRASRSDDLNDLIELKLREIIYHNEKERPGNATFRFELSKKRGVWRLDEIEVVHVRSGEKEVEVFEQKASYPRDFGLITMDEFDPFSDKLNAALLKNEKEIR